MYNGCPAWFLQCFIDCDCNSWSENPNERFLINIKFVNPICGWSSYRGLYFILKVRFFEIWTSPHHSNDWIMTQVSRALSFLISEFWGRSWAGMSSNKSVLIRVCAWHKVGSWFFILWFLEACIYQVFTVGMQSLALEEVCATIHDIDSQTIFIGRLLKVK